ncbi:HAD-IA family hydrolase [Candidatus Falkowbacteria bacterium]|jgi:L-ribulose-5-phosphate 4-epimerase|nr:HAD-IA family hydrolase [Candidatus Falkowbacteria bacterium]MBT7007416.1 HAD-IA family hydrolase [Candidatus Falkowbacteria bacterium]
MKKKVIFLDLDDTLCDSEGAYRLALKPCFEYLKSIYKKKISQATFVREYFKAREQIHHEQGNRASSHDRFLYFQQMFENLDVQLKPVWLNKIAKTYWQSTNKNLKIFPGVIETLEFIKRNGLKICIVSDLLTTVQLIKIKDLKIEKYIDYVVTSEEVGVEKPDKRVFIEALKKCKVKPAEVIMVGNSCTRDIAGAKGMKIETVHFGKENCPMADHHIKKFDDLIKIIEEEPFDSEDFAQDLREEGYIKFNYKWIDKATLSGKDVKELNSYRQKLYKMKFIGKVDRTTGYGNVSQRKKGKQFIITGSKTGLINKLAAKDYSLVKNYDFKKNSLTCEGKTVASSETLSHAIIYELSKQTNAIIHIHNKNLWKKLLNKVPTTSKTATYGTIDMTNEIKRLFKQTRLKDEKILTMAGHPDGIIVFGRDLCEAFSVLMKYYNLSK